MQLLAGTSGFSYKEWVGEFYPDKLAAKDMLAHYATRLPTVEINNTFYRMPNATSVQAWRSQVSDSFRFAIKVPRRISHIKRLRDCGAELRVLSEALSALGPCLGSLLVQLPPHARCDEAALAAFLKELPDDKRVAVLVRNRLRRGELRDRGKGSADVDDAVVGLGHHGQVGVHDLGAALPEEAAEACPDRLQQRIAVEVCLGGEGRQPQEDADQRHALHPDFQVRSRRVLARQRGGQASFRAHAFGDVPCRL